MQSNEEIDDKEYSYDYGPKNKTETQENDTNIDINDNSSLLFDMSLSQGSIENLELELLSSNDFKDSNDFLKNLYESFPNRQYKIKELTTFLNTKGLKSLTKTKTFTERINTNKMDAIHAFVSQNRGILSRIKGNNSLEFFNYIKKVIGIYLWFGKDDINNPEDKKKYSQEKVLAEMLKRGYPRNLLELVITDSSLQDKVIEYNKLNGNRFLYNYLHDIAYQAYQEGKYSSASGNLDQITNTYTDKFDHIVDFLCEKNIVWSKDPNSIKSSLSDQSTIEKAEKLKFCSEEKLIRIVWDIKSQNEKSKNQYSSSANNLNHLLISQEIQNLNNINNSTSSSSLPPADELQSEIQPPIEDNREETWVSLFDELGQDENLSLTLEIPMNGQTDSFLNNQEIQNPNNINNSTSSSSLPPADELQSEIQPPIEDNREETWDSLFDDLGQDENLSLTLEIPMNGQTDSFLNNQEIQNPNNINNSTSSSSLPTGEKLRPLNSKITRDQFFKSSNTSGNTDSKKTNKRQKTESTEGSAPFNFR